ncbi:uncharacterized protein V6R79_020438 [Siganus canaliculatus]
MWQQLESNINLLRVMFGPDRVHLNVLNVGNRNRNRNRNKSGTDRTVSHRDLDLDLDLDGTHTGHGPVQD